MPKGFFVLLVITPALYLRWHRGFFADPRWPQAAWASAKIALIATLCSVLLGLLASFGLVRGRFRGVGVLRALFLTPIILPVVVRAVALYAFFLRIGLNGTLPGFAIARSWHCHFRSAEPRSRENGSPSTGGAEPACRRRGLVLRTQLVRLGGDHTGGPA